MADFTDKISLDIKPTIDLDPLQQVITKLNDVQTAINKTIASGNNLVNTFKGLTIPGITIPTVTTPTTPTVGIPSTNISPTDINATTNAIRQQTLAFQQQSEAMGNSAKQIVQQTFSYNKEGDAIKDITRTLQDATGTEKVYQEMNLAKGDTYFKNVRAIKGYNDQIAITAGVSERELGIYDKWQSNMMSRKATQEEMTGLIQQHGAIATSVSERELAIQKNWQQKQGVMFKDNAQLMNSFSTAQQKAAILAQRMGGTVEGLTFSQGKWNAQLNIGSTMLGKFDVDTGRVVGKLKQMETGFLGSGQSLRDIIEKFGVWTIASGMVFGVIGILKDLTETIKEVDYAMGGLTKVYRGQMQDIPALKKDLVELSIAYGSSTTATIDAATRWAKLGYEHNDIVKLTTVSLLAQNVAELTAAQSTDYLSAALMSFKMNASGTITILDEWNRLSNTNVVTTRDLAEAVTRAGVVYRMAGADIEQLNAYTTAITASTKEHGEVTGRALRTIGTFAYRQETVNKIYELTGVRIKEVNAQTGKYTGGLMQIDEILARLASKWISLSDAEKEELSVAMAGTNQKTRFVALMENFNLALESEISQYKAAGSAAQENEIRMSSLANQMEQLRATIEKLYVQTGDAGLLGLLKILVITLKNFATGISSTTGLIAALAIVALLLKDRLIALSAATITWSGALTLLEKHPVIIAITALGIALQFIGEHIIKLKEQTEEYTDSLGRMSTELDLKQKSIKAESEQLEILSVKYSNMSEKIKESITDGKISNESKGKNITISKELAKAIGLETYQYDEYGMILGLTQSKLEELAKVKQREYEDSLKIARAKAVQDAKDLNDKIRLHTIEVEMIKERHKLYRELTMFIFPADMLNAILGTNQDRAKEKLDATQKALTSILQSIKDYDVELGLTTKDLEGQGELLEDNTKLQEMQEAEAYRHKTALAEINAELRIRNNLLQTGVQIEDSEIKRLVEFAVIEEQIKLKTEQMNKAKGNQTKYNQLSVDLLRLTHERTERLKRLEVERLENVQKHSSVLTEMNRKFDEQIKAINESARYSMMQAKGFDETVVSQQRLVDLTKEQIETQKMLNIAQEKTASIAKEINKVGISKTDQVKKQGEIVKSQKEEERLNAILIKSKIDIKQLTTDIANKNQEIVTTQRKQTDELSRSNMERIKLGQIENQGLIESARITEEIRLYEGQREQGINDIISSLGSINAGHKEWSSGLEFVNGQIEITKEQMATLTDKEKEQLQSAKDINIVLKEQNSKVQELSASHIIAFNKEKVAGDNALRLADEKWHVQLLTLQGASDEEIVNKKISLIQEDINKGIIEANEGLAQQLELRQDFLYSQEQSLKDIEREHQLNMIDLTSLNETEAIKKKIFALEQGIITSKNKQIEITGLNNQLLVIQLKRVQDIGNAFTSTISSGIEQIFQNMTNWGKEIQDAKDKITDYRNEIQQLQTEDAQGNAQRIAWIQDEIKQLEQESKVGYKLLQEMANLAVSVGAVIRKEVIESWVKSESIQKMVRALAGVTADVTKPTEKTTEEIGQEVKDEFEKTVASQQIGFNIGNSASLEMLRQATNIGSIIGQSASGSMISPSRLGELPILEGELPETPISTPLSEMPNFEWQSDWEEQSLGIFDNMADKTNKQMALLQQGITGALMGMQGTTVKEQGLSAIGGGIGGILGGMIGGPWGGILSMVGGTLGAFFGKEKEEPQKVEVINLPTPDYQAIYGREERTTVNHYSTVELKLWDVSDLTPARINKLNEMIKKENAEVNKRYPG